MKLVVKLDYSNSLVFPAEKSGAIVEAFSTGTRVYDSGCGENRTLKPNTDSTISFEFVEDAVLLEKEAPFEALQKQKKESDNKWLEEYRLRVDAQNKVKELEARLASLKTAVTADESPF